MKYAEFVQPLNDNIFEDRAALVYYDSINSLLSIIKSNENKLANINFIWAAPRLVQSISCNVRLKNLNFMKKKNVMNGFLDLCHFHYFISMAII